MNGHMGYTSTTTTVREYDKKGNLVRETVTVETAGVREQERTIVYPSPPWQPSWQQPIINYTVAGSNTMTREQLNEVIARRTKGELS